MRVAAIVAAICTRETTSMIAPARMMKPVSPTATPSSMIRPLRLGRYNDAIVATNWRASSTSREAAYGVRCVRTSR